MLCGSAQCGSTIPYLGTVDDISATPVGYDGAALSWTRRTQQSIDAVVAIYCDGILQALAPADGTAALANLTPGAHTLHADLIGKGAVAPQRIWNLAAQRAWLKWLPDTVPDLAAYLVQQQVGNTWTTIATITRSAIGSIAYALPTGTTGTGRLSIFGNVAPGVDLNGTVYFVVAGTALQLLHDDTVIDEREMITQATLIFNCGARVFVHDPVEQYTTDDAWQTTVGISCDWQSEILPAGSHLYRVLAQDVIGNKSTVGATMRVNIQQLPELPKAPTFTVADYGDGTFTPEIVCTPLSDPAAELRVFTNYNAVLNEWMDTVYTAAPYIVLTGSNSIVSFPDTGAGQLKCYLWSYKGGVLRDERTVYSVTMPQTLGDLDVSLGAVYGLTFTYNQSGASVIRWLYDLRTGKDCQEYHLLVNVNDSVQPIWESASVIPADEFIVSQTKYGFTSEVAGPEVIDGDQINIWIRASDGSGHFGDVVTLEMTVDLNPPPAPVIVLAMPS